MVRISMYADRDVFAEFARENGFLFSEVRKAQIYALYEEAGLKRAEICVITGYAPNTVSTMRYKMCDFANLAMEIFSELGEDVEVVIEPEVVEVPALAVLMRRFKDGRPPVPMEFMPGCGENLRGEQAVYFFKFYAEELLIFNKIGTSAKDVIARLRDEIGEYSKKFDIRRVEIHRIHACGNCPAEGAESALRAELIRQYPNAFRKNDRFFNVDIDPAVFDEIVNKYFG